VIAVLTMSLYQEKIEKFHLNDCFTAIIAGSSKSGKSTAAISIALNYEKVCPTARPLGKCVLIYSTWQSLYEKLIDELPDSCTIQTHAGLPADNASLPLITDDRTSERVQPLSRLTDDPDRDHSILFLVDDVLTNAQKQNKFLEDLVSVQVSVLGTEAAVHTHTHTHTHTISACSILESPLARVGHHPCASTVRRVAVTTISCAQCRLSGDHTESDS